MIKDSIFGLVDRAMDVLFYTVAGIYDWWQDFYDEWN